MNYIHNIGIIGLGFVGDAIKSSMDDLPSVNLILIDKDPSKGSSSYNDIKTCDGIFVCVPTPFGEDGKCNTSILEEVLENLKDFEGVIISKCTAPPGTYKQLGEKFKNLVHAPEFLTAANAKFDYETGKFSIIGGSVLAYQHEAKRIIELGQRHLNQIEFCSIQEAALAKYTINSFLSTKVIFMNEIYKLATQTGMDYDLIARMIVMDERIGNSHMRVPGPDGQFGFGGMCFPKDTFALLKYAESINVDLSVLNAAVKKNTLLRLT